MGIAQQIILFIFLGFFLQKTAWGQEDEAIFQELSCSYRVESEKATRLGKSYPNSLCFIQNILGEGEGLFASQIAQDQIHTTLSFLKRECERDLEKANPVSKELLQRACSFPQLYHEFLAMKANLSIANESIEIFSDWNMTDLIAGNYAQIPFSEEMPAIELVTALIIAEKQLIQSLDWVVRLIRHLAPTGLNVEIIGLRMHAALVSYSKPKVLITLLDNLHCENLKSPGSQRNCEITKDVVYFNIRSILENVSGGHKELIEHVTELSGELTSDKTFEDRDSLIVGNNSYSTRPKIERLAFVIQTTQSLSKVQRNKRFEFVSWEQEELKNLREGLDKMNSAGGFPESAIGEVSKTALLYRSMHDIVLVSQIKESIKFYNPTQRETSEAEFNLWRNNHFLRKIQEDQYLEFEKSLNDINGFLGSFADPKENS